MIRGLKLPWKGGTVMCGPQDLPEQKLSAPREIVSNTIMSHIDCTRLKDMMIPSVFGMHHNHVTHFHKMSIKQQHLLLNKLLKIQFFQNWNFKNDIWYKWIIELASFIFHCSVTSKLVTSLYKNSDFMLILWEQITYVPGWWGTRAEDLKGTRTCLIVMREIYF